MTWEHHSSHKGRYPTSADAEGDGTYTQGQDAAVVDQVLAVASEVS
jgi:hypothetical protein